MSTENTSPRSNEPMPASFRDRISKIELSGSPYADLAFSFWNETIDRILEELRAGKNVALCAPQGIGKTGFAAKQIIARWNKFNLGGNAVFFDCGSEVNWDETFVLAVIDESLRFALPPRKDPINISHYSTVKEPDSRLGVNASRSDLSYLIDKARSKGALLMLIVPDTNIQSRSVTQRTFEDNGISVISLDSPTLNPSAIRSHLKSLDLKDEVIERIVTDRFLLNPNVYCEFVSDVLRDAILHDHELTTESLEAALRYWSDPSKQPRPNWVPARPNNLINNLSDEEF